MVSDPQRAYEKALKRFKDQPGVTGLLVGKKRTEGQVLDDLGVCVLVEKKKPKSQLKSTEVVPKTIDGIKTDVQETGGPSKPLLLQSSPRSRYDIVQPGISIGPEGFEGSGTIGLIVNDDTESEICFLTCWHVVAPHQLAPETYIIQPGRPDGGRDTTDRCGEAGRYEISTYGDAALVTLSRDYAVSVLSTHQIVTALASASVGDQVKKMGRSTGETEGEVAGTGYLAVDYSDWGQGTINVTGFIFEPLTDPTEEIVASGDSGALVYKPSSGAGLGILTSVFENSGTVTGFACNLATVLTQLNASLLSPTLYCVDGRGSLNVATPCSVAAHGTLTVAKKHAPLVFKCSGIPNNAVTYSDMDGYAQAQGYADTTDMLTSEGYSSELEYAQAEGHKTVSEFLTNKGTPSVETILSNNGVTRIG